MARTGKPWLRLNVAALAKTRPIGVILIGLRRQDCGSCSVHERENLFVPAQQRTPMPARKPTEPESSSLSTAEILALAVAGEHTALNDLFQQYWPALKRSAHGRLPSLARSRGDTEDLVQDALLSFIQRMQYFKVNHRGALLAFIRVSITNRIRDEARRVARRPAVEDTDVSELPSSTRSPFDEAEMAETSRRYERALAELRQPDREAIRALEAGRSYEQMAEDLAKPSANAARVAARRAFEKLLVKMDEQSGERVQRKAVPPRPRSQGSR
jgi:RNA polymerase sigma-70 factor (ECF subfamily)